MFEAMLFLHLIGLLIWVGSLLTMMVVMSYLKNKTISAELGALAKHSIRISGLLAHPAAVIVLISGIIMLVTMELGADRPLWLLIMERGGGMIILAALVLTGIFGRKAKQRLTANDGSIIKFSGFVPVMAGILLSIIGVVFVVSMRI